VQFVGFMAAFRAPGPLNPDLAGTLGGVLAMWSTFVPSFLWIFLGGPYIEALRDNKSLTASLSAITAAVVGVILNLAVWLALHTLFGQIEVRHVLGMTLQIPDLRTVNVPALLLSIGAIIAMFRFKLGMLPTFAACSAAGIILYFLGGIR
jgi:chromate transporter